jgi:hypothetical protein
MFCSAGELSCPSRKKAASADQNRSNAKSLPQIGSVEKHGAGGHLSGWMAFLSGMELRRAWR